MFVCEQLRKLIPSPVVLGQATEQLREAPQIVDRPV